MSKINSKKKRSTPAASASKKAETRKVSPDSVTCIDLTIDDDEVEMERRFGAIRKELDPPSARKSKGGFKTTGLDDVDDDEVIVIDSDSDNDIASTGGKDVSRTGAIIASQPTTKKRVKKEGALSSSKRKKLVGNVDNGDMDCEEVEIVQAEAPKLAAATMVAESAAASTNKSGDDDVVVEGVLNETRLPHMRQHCIRCPFTHTELSRSNKNFSVACKANSKSCDLCYCYVCDCPVKDCQHWYSSTSTKPEDNHCCASDKDYKWERMRSRAKTKKKRSTSSGSTDDESDDDPPIGYHFMKDCPCSYYTGEMGCDNCWCYVCDEPAEECTNYYAHRYACPTSEHWRNMRQRRKLSTYGLPGPFEPDNTDAPLDKGLTKCRHCSWYVRLDSFSSRASSRDWCTRCGRVASEKDLGKDQVKPTNEKVNPTEEPYLFGQKEITFRIKAHDPRLFEKYKESWEEDESDYNDAEREEEVYLHRLGKNPTFGNLLRSIPYVEEGKIPTTLETDDSYSSNRNDWELQDATDAVIIDDSEQFQFLYTIASIGDSLPSDTSTTPFELKVTTSWDSKTRSGTFKIQLLIPKRTFIGQGNRSSSSHSEKLLVVLGLWYGLFPLQPSEICGLLNASSSKDVVSSLRNRRSWEKKFTLPIAPYRVDLDEVIDDVHEELDHRLESFSKAKSTNESQLSLSPSNGSRFSGGVCPSISSNPFRDTIVSFFSEQFASLIRNSYSYRTDFVASCVGAIRGDSYETLHALLGFQTAATSGLCFAEDASNYNYKNESPSIEHTMHSVESLGHASEDCIEGLKIELLDFQRQSLKWALEREQTPGGIQSFIWPKLPSRGEGQEDLYFNPILNLFRKEKPRLVRGGFIAEQMGLGKTVISLALILKNPAPAFPLSGSPISALQKKDPNNVASSSCGWDKNLYQYTSITNQKTGSVISKGTLVICPVSLVGQWIDEARSKLNEPGLIYPYHGQSRKRNPNILAANSIVVTTYDVLASDAFHHAKKGGSDYCPPLQQVRWWRIICDEGHSLRESNTRRSKATLSLVGDHKWIVSGTPMNTSHDDLKNQIRFLGYEHVPNIFNALYSKRSYSGRGKKEIDSKLLMYFLRPIMMRHSQEQKYRGTSTTLMSLPPKTERKELVRFTSKEKKEFGKLEKDAQDWYIKFRSAHLKKISKYFLKISSKLTPLRIACSGGKYPLNTDISDDEDDMGEGTDSMNTDADNEDGEERKKAAKNRSTTATTYSKFVFKSKFQALLKQLKKIRDDEPDSKSLVFSQFSSTLDWLKIELPKHGFQFRTLSGDMSMKKRAKALSEFQNDPPTTIFLLSMRAGAVGINLTQANRVFLMEPSFNPALEAQAIGRIHRLGQKRPVEIVRLVVKNSFEDRMMAFLEQKYGSKSQKQEQTESENDASDKKTVDNDASDKKTVDQNICNTIAGNLKTDKAQLVAEEFDILFGVKDRLLADSKDEDDKKSDSKGGGDKNYVVSL